MGTRSPDRISIDLWRTRAETVGVMAHEGWRVWSECRRCGRRRAVDLDKVASVWGSAFSLWDLDLLECPVRLCRGQVVLMVQPPAACPAFPAFAATAARPNPPPPPNNALWSARRRARAWRRKADMGEIETRLAAVELVILELIPWIDPAAVADAERSIRAGLETAGGDELAIRRGALGLIEDGKRRFAPPATGIVL